MKVVEDGYHFINVINAVYVNKQHIESMSKYVYKASAFREYIYMYMSTPFYVTVLYCIHCFVLCHENTFYSSF
jgi:hypothetical protein